MAIEKHPHLHLFDEIVTWQTLLIGTFPPNSSLRAKSFVDYFYGNAGTLWRIIHDIYKDQGYDFLGGTSLQNLAQIRRWQYDYCVGITDTIISCSRKHPLSTNDADLRDIEYNYSLKEYILKNLRHIKKIIFTSSFGKNSAFVNFRHIMGAEIVKVADRLVTGLPSPSGSANITFFNSNREETLGLDEDFFNYVAAIHAELLPEFRKRWEQKKV